MSDASGTDRHERPRDRVTERLDALEAQAREQAAWAQAQEVRAQEQLAQIEALREDLDELRDDSAGLRAELRAVVAGQGALAAQVGGLQVAVAGLVAQITDPETGLAAQLRRLASRVPSGAQVAVGGGALGLGSVLSIAYAAAQALGWIGG